MTVRRGGTPLLSTNAPSLEAAHQSQINDLIQRTRTLEHTNKKLIAQIDEEKNRSKAFVKEIQDKHEANQRHWKESCEDVLASYRIIQKQLALELEKERYSTLAEMEIAREEKLQRIQRDYNLKLFQMQEEELERRLEVAEEEKYDLQDQLETIGRKWQDRCREYATKLKDAQEALDRTESEKQDKESKLNKLRESHANLDAEKETFEAKLTRASLNLGSEQDKNKELTKEVNDAKRRIKDLTRQVEEWQKLDNSEGAQVETQRKKRMALEQEIQELTEKHEKELDRCQRSLEKEKERAEKVKEARDSLEEEAKTHKKEAVKANALVKRLEKKMEKLKEDLEVERARVRPTSPEKVHTLSSADHSVSDQAEIEEAVRTDKSDDAATKPASKRGPTIKAGLSNQFADNKTKGLKEQVARKRTGGRKPVLKPDSDIEEISDHAEKENEGGAAEATRKGKGKAKALEPDVIDDNDNPVEMKGKRKREAASDEESVQIVGVSKAKRGARAASKGPAAVGRGRSKPPSSRARSRQGSVMPVVEDDGVGEEAQPAVKKRKMLFPTEGKGATTILAGFGGSGVEIPTQLSPVPQNERVPQRSIMGSLSSLRLSLQR